MPNHDIIDQKFKQINKTKEDLLEALCLLCSTPSKIWTNMNHFYYLLFSKDHLKQNKETSDISQNIQEKEIQEKEIQEKDIQEKNIQEQEIELDQNMFKHLIILKSEEHMNGIAYFLTKAIRDGYYVDCILTPFVMRSFINEAMNGNSDCLNFLTEALLLPNTKIMYNFWKNEYICDEIADLIEQNPPLYPFFEKFFRKLLKSGNEDLKNLILLTFHDTKLGIIQ